MRINIHYPSFDFPGTSRGIVENLVATAHAAEQGGCAQFTCMDHYFQMEGYAPVTDAMLEGYTTLGFLAAQTERMTLGLLVTGVTYRHPGILAKIVATLDVLSGGRAQLGIGAAWYEREHHGLGVPFPSTSERFERLEETLQICRQMWGDDDGPYTGTHYQLAETLCRPRPLQSPAPPIMIGGVGEKKTLRLVAEYADSTNLFGLPVDQLQHKLEVLDCHCADVGRDPAEITRTVVVDTDPLEDPDGFVATMEAYAALGISQVWLSPRGPDPADWVRRTVDAVGDRLAALGD